MKKISDVLLFFFSSSRFWLLFFCWACSEFKFLLICPVNGARISGGGEELIQHGLPHGHASTARPHHHLGTTRRPDHHRPTVGPIILPEGTVETEESSYEDDDDDEQSPEVTATPDRAGNCRALAHLCHQLAYRRVLQRFCQKTCGRDDCLDQREDLCVHWKRHGFCTHPFYERMRWRCARTCGICRVIGRR